jgi:hypothetical protein
LIKLIKRIIFLAFVLSGAFLYLALTGGGERIRLAGDYVSQGADGLAATADIIHETTQAVKASAAQTARAVKETGQGLRETARHTQAAITNTAEAIQATADKMRGLTPERDEARAPRDSGNRSSAGTGG